MKKKIIILLTVCLFLILGIIGFVIWKNRTTSIITLDINPSIEISLKSNGNVKKVKPLNDDAKDIVKNITNNKTLSEVVDILTRNLLNNGYVTDENTINILMYCKGNITNEEVDKLIVDNFTKKDVMPFITVIENVTKEDEEYAKKSNISVSKAAYINIISKDNNIDADVLLNKPIKELEETKMRGKYCDSDYTLEGDFCIKEINRIFAKSGMVCENGYYEYDGKCYEEEHFVETEKLVCRDEFTLVDDKCIKEDIIDATPSKYSCSKGEVKTKGEVGMAVKGSGDARELVCVDSTNITHPVIPCELPASDPTERTFSGGKCYWHRAPVIEAGCPGKIQIGSFCWDDASNVYLCPNGYNSNERTKDDYCYTVLKNVVPTVTEYTCQEGYTLENNKCVKKEIEDAFHENICPLGYTKVDYNRCINKNAFKNKIDGYYCEEENSRLKGNTCIIYDVIEARHN